MKRLIVVVLFFFLVAASLASNSVEKLESQLSSVSGKEKIALLLEIAELTYLKAPDKCLVYCRQAIELTHRWDEPGSRAKALHYMNMIYVVKGEKEKSLECLKEALSIYESLGDKSGIAMSLVTLSRYYMGIDYYLIAQDYLLRALKIWEELGDLASLYTGNFSLGILHYNLKDYDKAMEYFDKAMAIAKELKREKMIMSVSLYIGVCSRRMKNYPKALDYLKQSLTQAEKFGITYYTAMSSTFIGDVYGQMGRYNDALAILSKAKNQLKETGDKSTLAYNQHFSGKVSVMLRDFKIAMSYYDRAIELAKELNDKQMLERVYKSYSNLFEQTGDYKKAFEYYQLYTETNESIFNENKMKQIAQLQIQFEAEKRQKEIEILTRDNEIQAITRNTSIIVLILVIIILALVFKKYLYLMAFWKSHKYVGQYRLIDRIGSGGMGTVFLAHPVNDKKQRVAVKVLRDELIEDQSSRKRFKHEGMVIDKLEHPNIVKTIERGESEGKLYIVMEYLDAKTLAHEIKNNSPLALKFGLEIMLQLAGALSFIHEKKVVHRDIKPANVMLTPGNIKLLDFGLALAEFQTRLTQSGILVGTINYTAPEQITENIYSAASDVYSLGVTYYEILTGQLPFPAESVTMVIERILDTQPGEPVKLRPEINPELNVLVMSMLDKSPSNRPSAADVLDRLTAMI